jgi:hypothetical protein
MPSSTYHGVRFCLVISIISAVLPLRAADAVQNEDTTQVANTTSDTTVKPKPALAGLLRNPAMGWVLYMETLGDDTYPLADRYWQQADPYVPSASIFYVRCTWAQMEPQEGHFAWKEDANFQAVIADALQRHLKLAFRIVVDSADCQKQATPGWVQDAGAQGSTEIGKGHQDMWNPFVTDPVFREKMEDFVAAFAKEYDDPSGVDFIDGCGLGTWGEMHHLNAPPADYPETYEWSCQTYGHAFHHVLLGTQFASQMSVAPQDDRMAFDQYGYVAKRDSLGSSWLSPTLTWQIAGLYPKVPFFGESCFFSLESWDVWKSDGRGFKTVRDVLQSDYDDAMKCHANTLDLREPKDAATWMKLAPDLVASFLAQGGYRLYPVAVEYPAKFPGNQPATIQHRWKNLGVGIMPNDNPRWNKKYRVAFALLDPGTKKVVATAIDGQADPGAWISGQEVPNTCSAQFKPAPAAGSYLLATAIVNTQDGDTPEIQLATADLAQSDGWSVLGPVSVEAAAGNGP